MRSWAPAHIQTKDLHSMKILKEVGKADSMCQGRKDLIVNGTCQGNVKELRDLDTTTDGIETVQDP